LHHFEHGVFPLAWLSLRQHFFENPPGFISSAKMMPITGEKIKDTKKAPQKHNFLFEAIHPTRQLTKSQTANIIMLVAFFGFG
jgi:hypothetical protein